MPTSKSSTHLLLSLTTAPLLLALIGSRALAELAKEIGLASEEIFRGDRLPTLKISSTLPSDQEDP